MRFLLKTLYDYLRPLDYAGKVIQFATLLDPLRPPHYAWIMQDYAWIMHGLCTDYAGLCMDYAGLRMDYPGLYMDYAGLCMDYAQIMNSSILYRFFRVSEYALPGPSEGCSKIEVAEPHPNTYLYKMSLYHNFPLLG